MMEIKIIFHQITQRMNAIKEWKKAEVSLHCNNIDNFNSYCYILKNCITKILLTTVYSSSKTIDLSLFISFE
jgi:hypothetical protein